MKFDFKLFMAYLKSFFKKPKPTTVTPEPVQPVVVTPVTPTPVPVPTERKPTITEILFGMPVEGSPAPEQKPAEDLSYRYGPVIDWNKPGDLWYFTGSGGRKTFSVPEGYVGRVVLQMEINTNSKHSLVTTSLDGGAIVGLMGQGQTHDVQVTGPSTHTVDVVMDQPGGCTLVLRHYP
jgi:hypothetical protein